jgi:Kef-type K+ transport system membrane component KefB
MSAPVATKSGGARVTQAAALVVVFGVLFAATRLVPDAKSVVGTVAGLGFLLLAGTLMSELAETIGLPHLSGYILAGLIAGPYVLHLIDHDTVERLSPINTLALALIALAGGCELRMTTLRETARSLSWAILFQTGITFVVGALTFLALSRFIPFATSLTISGFVGVSLLWGSIAITRSPSALLGILAQTQAKGPLATFSLAFIMLSDVVVILIVAITIVLVRPLLDPGSGLSFNDLSILGREIIGSIALGTTLGLILAGYLKVMGGKLLVVLLAIGVGLSELLRYIQFDALLTFLVAGFVVENMSDQGPKLLAAVERTGTVVFVIFFALAGAHLEVPILVDLWPVALTLCATRAIATVAASRISARVAEDVPVIRSWGWSSLVSQAGLALGVSLLIVRAFPQIGETFRSLAIAAVAINEIVGPILFKLGLDRAHETQKGRAALAVEPVGHAPGD